MTRLQEIPWVEAAPPVVQAGLASPPRLFRTRLDLNHLPLIRPLIQSRWPQFLLRLLTLVGLVFTLLAGLLGSSVGAHNFAIIFVWIAWWSTLKLGFIPLGGRSWCSICPLPLPGDWLQQGGILEPGRHPRGLNLRWPRRLKGSWLQSAGFLLIGLFSAVTLTSPQVTGWVLLGLLVLAVGMSLVFERRAFCSHVCPVGGFSSLYARAAPVEVRPIDRQVCDHHTVKTCYQACPWGYYPVSFRDSSTCGLCMECLRACPEDNLSFNIRSLGAGLVRQEPSPHLDEPFLALVMLGSVMAFAAVFTGAWGWLKTAALDVGSLRWAGYALGYLAINLLLLPAAFVSATWLGQKFTRTQLPLKRLLARQGQVLVPLGLMAWIAFTVSFALPKLSYVMGVLNDPFGWGWHSLGAASVGGWQLPANLGMLLQVGILLAGLFWSARLSQQVTAGLKAGSSRPNLPVLLFCAAFTLAMLGLLLG